MGKSEKNRNFKDMKLNPSKGNMYDFVTHTGNAIKGKCPHGCTYCFVKRWKNQRDVRLDELELKGDIGSGKFIFIGSSCDMFAHTIPDEWIYKVLDYCSQFDNKYLFQTKDPKRLIGWISYLPVNSVLCTTIETNRFYSDIMCDCPSPENRAYTMNELSHEGFDTYVTIEPILDFDVDELFELITICRPEQVNIGADSGGNKMPEPSVEKIMMLIEMLKGFTTIHRKNNLNRLLK